MGAGGQRHPHAALPPGKTRYPLYRRLGGPQSRSGRVRKISPPTGIRSPNRPVRVESLYRLSYPGSPQSAMGDANPDVWCRGRFAHQMRLLSPRVRLISIALLTLATGWFITMEDVVRSEGNPYGLWWWMKWHWARIPPPPSPQYLSFHPVNTVPQCSTLCHLIFCSFSTQCNFWKSTDVIP